MSTDFTLTPIAGGVAATPGVLAAGISAGLKPSGSLDMALVTAPSTVAAAAVQTRNQVTAAPVQVTARNIADARARAVLLNAGSANVCTGPDGLELAEESTRVTAAALGCDPADILVCSTGVIGVPIPAQPFLAGIPQLVDQLASDGGDRAAQAIMTTDTAPKQSAFRIADASGSCVVGGMVKGSGMIAPEMATMLCVVTTDAPIAGAVLRATIRDVVARTFNRISVDDCMSTNDAVVVLATGSASTPPSLAAFAHGLTAVCASLAEQLVRDGEGAKKFVRIRVTGATSEADAVSVGRAIARSALVRTAIAGEDPNWGRILAAMGAGPARFDPNRVSVAFGGVTVCRFGVVASFDHGQAVAALRGKDITITVDLGAGDQDATFLTCDLTHDYITINAEYTT